LVHDFDKLSQANTKGIAHDLAILEKKPRVRKEVLAPEERRAMRAARAEARIPIKLKEPELKKGYAAQRKAAQERMREEMGIGMRRAKALDVARAEVRRKVSAQEAALALGGLLPKIVQLGCEDGIFPKHTKLFKERLNRL